MNTISEQIHWKIAIGCKLEMKKIALYVLLKVRDVVYWRWTRMMVEHFHLGRHLKNVNIFFGTYVLDNETPRMALNIRGRGMQHPNFDPWCNDVKFDDKMLEKYEQTIFWNVNIET